ncbi:caspase domain-containing protein [Armillaria mellea]|nr:caspase domain-containing protein [Armillaria mellea]
MTKKPCIQHTFRSTHTISKCQLSKASVPQPVTELKDEVHPAPPVHGIRSDESTRSLTGTASPRGTELRLAKVGKRVKSLSSVFNHFILGSFPKNDTSGPCSDDSKNRQGRLRFCPQLVPSRKRPSARRILPSLIRRAPHRVDASRFWAVLIGIDAYESRPLNGCVSDASLMKNFLINDLGLPKERIQCLLGSHNLISDGPLTPSRANIVNTLHSLIHNDEIQLGDNIVIYYAGHGSSYCYSERFDTEESGHSTDFSSIEALCPVDRDSIDTNGLPIPDISDRELNALFTEISRVKGHNITFIVDCCHASSFDRGTSGTGIRTTPITVRASLTDMFRAADERLQHLPSYTSVSSEDWQPSTGSHVILAACRDYQLVRETVGKDGCGGVFTSTLVRVLRSGAWKKETTYVGLTELLNQSFAQTPVVAGEHMHERLWYQG